MPDQAVRPDAAVLDGFFQPRRLGHVNLYVDDIDRSMRFYIDHIGIEEVYRTPLAGGGFVSNGNTHHDVGFTDANGPLGKPRGARPGQLSHIAFELDSERGLVDSYARATAAGATFLRTADHDVAHSVYGLDPEGNAYELYADVVKDWRRQRSGIITKPKPNWAPGSTPVVEEPCWHAEPEIRRVSHAVFHPRQTTHATLVVADLEGTLAYYTAVIGLTVLHRDPGDAFAELGGSLGRPTLVLIAAHPGLAPGYHHVGMVVDDPADLARSVTAAKDAGLEIVTDLGHCGRRSVMVRDPDGCLVQLYSDAGGDIDPASITPGLAAYIL